MNPTDQLGNRIDILRGGNSRRGICNRKRMKGRVSSSLFTKRLDYLYPFATKSGQWSKEQDITRDTELYG